MKLLSDNKWIKIEEKLPELGQRVRVLVIKELIYMGDEKDKSSLWTDDGNGERKIISWGEIREIKSDG